MQRALHIILILTLVATQALAAETPEAFRVTGHNINAEGERAEVCLMFSRPIAIADRAALAAALQLKKDGVKVSIAPHDLSLNPSEVCVQQLEHHRRYQLTLKTLRDQDNTPLDEPFTLAFTVPDRKPSLTFTAKARGGDVPRIWKTYEKGDKDKANAPLVGTVQAVNVNAVRLTLYRITDRNSFVGAWQQKEQVGLAPSESLYFATHNGQQVWQSDLVFSDDPNAEQNMAIPMPPRGELQPGLYFLAAAPRATANPVLLAGLWFLVSDLKLTAVSNSDGVHVTAADVPATRVAPAVALQLLTSDGHVLAEAKGDNNGIALLAAPPDQRKNAAYVTGVTAAGDVDIVDLTPDSAFIPPRREALLATDRTLYQPGSMATVTLLARDEHGQAQKVSNSFLKLLRPDQSFYSEQLVPDDKTGVQFLTVPLPETSIPGLWTLLWQQADGTVLGKTNVRLTPEIVEPKINVTADRSLIDQDGIVTLTIKATGASNEPLAWRTGKVTGRQGVPEFSAWKDYFFGSANTAAAEDVRTASFLTSADGTAQVRMQIPLTGDAALTRAVTLNVKMETAVAPVSLTIPVNPQIAWLGIHDVPDDKPFTEKGQVSFDVIALDANGKRRALGDLYFQIYEEGRSFEWYPAEGHWEYRPLPQHRRSGGGRLSLAANGDNIIRWPVTAGHYVLEITDGNGAVLAQHEFDTGWRAPSSTAARSDPRLKLGVPKTPSASANNVIFTLAAPAMVNVTIGDDRVRQTINRFMPAGDTVVGIVPSEDWGHPLQIRAQAVFADGGTAASTLSLPLQSLQQALTFDITPPSAVVTGSILSLPVTVKKKIVVSRNDNARSNPVLISAQATPIAADGSTEFSSVTQIAIPVDRDGKAMLHFTLPSFTGSLRVTLSAWQNKQFISKTVTIPAKQAVTITASPLENLAVGDRAFLNIRLENNAGTEGAYAYALAVPVGLKVEGAVKGTATLKRGQSQTLSLTLTGEKETQEALRFDLTGPGAFHATRLWPVNVGENKPASLTLTPRRLEPQQTLTLASKTHDRNDDAFVMASPVPLLDAPRQIQTVLTADPFTTAELARWLETTWHWQGEIAASGMMGETNLQSLRASRLRQLLLRQNEDGGFPAWPSGSDGFAAASNAIASDIVSTAAALTVLQDASHQAASLAASWLQHKLENTWFDESERAPRAAGFLALSTAGRGDLSALRYFSDTSRDKELTPLADAQIALALAQNHDDDAARFWIQRARESLPQLVKTSAQEAWPLLQVLAANALLNPRDLLGDIDQASMSSPPTTMDSAAALLQTIETLRARNGSWHLGVSGADRKVEGFYVASLPEKPAALTLHNASNESLYVVQAESGGSRETGASKTENPISVQRQFYNLSGERIEAGKSLVPGRAYLLELHGTGKTAKTPTAPFLVTLSASAGLQPIASAGIDPSIFTDMWPWLPQPLTTLDGVAATPEGMNAAFQPTDDWRIVYLVKAAQAGDFSLPPVTLRDLAGDSVNVTQNQLRYQVR